MPADDDSPDAAARSVKSRRDRLAALKARHQDVTPASPARPAPAAGRGGGAAGGGAAAAARRINPQQKQMLARVYRMLTQGQDDGSGKVPGTPFLRGGITRVMGLLTERAAATGAPGQKVAASALRFIEAKDGEEAVGGASVEKLKLLAGRVESMRVRGGGGAGGASVEEDVL